MIVSKEIRELVLGATGMSKILGGIGTAEQFDNDRGDFQIEALPVHWRAGLWNPGRQQQQYRHVRDGTRSPSVPHVHRDP